MPEQPTPVERRSFLSRFGIGMAALGLAAVPVACAQTESAKAAGFTPAHHSEDDWYEELPGRHRFVLDTTTPAAAGEAILYAANFFTANKSGYNLDPQDLAVVIILRHFSTPFAYNAAIWMKYGPAFSQMANFNDPKTNQPLTFNIYSSPDYGMTLPNFGNTIDSLIERGVRFAVCDMATHFLAMQLANQTKGDADMIYQDLAGNLIPNARLVTAGIVAVNRAQERGYTLASVS